MVREIGVAIIGAGLIGSHYARICAQMVGVRLVAVHDVDPVRASQLAAELGVPGHSGPDYAPPFERNDTIDAVFVCTPEDSHVQPALAALRAGKHLMIEKPLARTLPDARLIADAAAQSPGITMVGYSLRFDPRYAAMKEAVDAGEVGDIIYLAARRNPTLDAFERIRGRVELPFWVGVHDIDMMRWLTGDEITDVYATSTYTGFEGTGVRRAILANFTFAGGAIATLENAWRAASVSSRQLSEAAFRVQGTRGQIDVQSTPNGLQVITDGGLFAPDTTSMSRVSGEIVGTYRNQVAAFIRAVRDNLPSPVPVADGVRGVAVAEAILRSLDERRPVTVER